MIIVFDVWNFIHTTGKRGEANEYAKNTEQG